MKKKIIALMLLACMFLLPTTAFAATQAQEVGTKSADDVIQLRAEQISYYYRVVNGRVQFRIWSATYGYWLTDWAWA